MLIRTSLSQREHGLGVLAVAVVALFTLAPATAGTQPVGGPGSPTPAVIDDGSGRTLPPAPGPTDPNGP